MRECLSGLAVPLGTWNRPGQGFWVYGIPGHFSSGIWYFFGQNSGIKYSVFLNFRYSVDGTEITEKCIIHFLVLLSL